MVNKILNVLFDVCVFPSLVIVYVFFLIKIYVELVLINEKTTLGYVFYITKLNLDVAISEYPLLMNYSFSIISAIFYYSLFLILI